MINRRSLLKLFKDQSIIHKLILHPPIFTVEDSKKIRGKIKGAHTKNLFLKNKKNNFFLFSCLESTNIDLKILRKALGLGNISFANEENLREMLNLMPGSVTPFGLLNDINNKITFYFDKKLTYYDSLNFHPLDNTATININTTIFLNFMNSNKKLVNIIDFDTYTLNNE